MEPHLAQSLYTILLRAAKARLREQYTEGGVQLNFDVNNSKLTGTFEIPLEDSFNTENGEYILKAKDFLV